VSGILQVPNALLGIDVSHFQGAIDWVSVAESGVKFAFIKATDGASVSDPMLKQNIDGATAAGLPYGLYHFWRPQQPAESQAANFLNAVTEDAINAQQFANVLDIETGALTEDCQDQALAWLSAIEQASPKLLRPVVYVSPSYAQVNLTDPAWQGSPLWTAHYTELPQPSIGKWPKWTFWQRQGDGEVPGISGLVDIDWFNGDSAAFAQFVQLPT